MTRLKTSYRLAVGTSNSRTFRMGGPKKPASRPSARYSSQPQESTTFTDGRIRGRCACRSRAAIPAPRAAGAAGRGRFVRRRGEPESLSPAGRAAPGGGSAATTERVGMLAYVDEIAPGLFSVANDGHEARVARSRRWARLWLAN